MHKNNMNLLLTQTNRVSVLKENDNTCHLIGTVARSCRSSCWRVNFIDKKEKRIIARFEGYRKQAVMNVLHFLFGKRFKDGKIIDIVDTIHLATKVTKRKCRSIGFTNRVSCSATFSIWCVCVRRNYWERTRTRTTWWTDSNAWWKWKRFRNCQWLDIRCIVSSK